MTNFEENELRKNLNETPKEDIIEAFIIHVDEKTHGFNREDDSPHLYFCRYFID